MPSPLICCWGDGRDVSWHMTTVRSARFRRQNHNAHQRIRIPVPYPVCRRRHLILGEIFMRTLKTNLVLSVATLALLPFGGVQTLAREMPARSTSTTAASKNCSRKKAGVRRLQLKNSRVLEPLPKNNKNPQSIYTLLIECWLSVKLMHRWDREDPCIFETD